MTADGEQSARRWYRFGPYVVDRRSRLLWRNDTLVPLTAKAFEILIALLEHRHRVVDKDELHELIWPNTAVEENTLTRHISTLRKALEEHPGQHHFILTVPGHGYQFVADVAELTERPAHLHHSVASRAQHGVDEMIDTPVNGIPPISVEPAAIVPAQSRAVRSVAVLGGLLAVAAGVGVFLSLNFRNGEAPPASAPILRKITFQAGLQREPVFSPDGRRVAYTSSSTGNSDIWVQSLNEPTPNQIVSSATEDSQPDWSPDGEWLVFRSERDGGGLYVVPAAGGIERKLTNFGYQPRWSPDGSLVLFSSSGHEGGRPRFYVVAINGDTPLPLRPDVAERLTDVSVNWKPANREVSFWGREQGDWRFVTVPVAEGPPRVSAISTEVHRRIEAAGVELGRFTWARSGRYLYFEGRTQGVRNLWRVAVDPATLAWVGGPDRLTTGAGDDADIAVSVDGTRLVFSAKTLQTRLWSFPFNAAQGRVTGAGEPVTSGGAGEQDAEALRDGSKIVYSAVRAGRQELWERSMIDRRERLVMARSGWTLTRPHWSPDGTRIAYSRRPSGRALSTPDAVVAVLTVQDGAEHTVTKPGDARFVPSDWSANGSQLIGGCPQGSGKPVATCVLDVNSTEARVRTIASHPTHNLFEQRYSPDQRWVSFMAVDNGDAGQATIYVMPVAGGPWQAITDGRAYDDKPHWSPDGRMIYFASDRGGLWNVWGRRFDPADGKPVGDPFRVTSFDSPRQTLATQLSRMQFAVTADRLFLPLTETSGELWMLENIDK